MTKLFYARVSDSCGIYTSHDDPLGATGNRWFGRGTPSEKAREQLAELTKDYQTGVFIRAIDPFTGKKVWDFPAPAGRSGVLSTAGGLIFLGGGGGLLVARREDGKAALERQYRADDAGVADDLHGGRQTVHRAAGNELDHGLRAGTESQRSADVSTQSREPRTIDVGWPLCGTRRKTQRQDYVLM